MDKKINPPSPKRIAILNRNEPHVSTPKQLEKAIRKDNAIQYAERKANEMKSLAFRHDGWANVMTGMGGNMSKRAYSYYSSYPVIDDPQLERLYFGDGIAARIIDTPPDDMTREWINLKADDEDSVEEEDDLDIIGEVMNEADAQTVFNLALKWKGLYGGSMVVMGFLDGQTLDQPLNPSRIRQLDYLKVIDRSDIDLFQSVYQNDPTKPGFGQPELLYCYFQVGVIRYPKLVHISRCIIFKGKPVPNGATPTTNLNQRFWGMSELVRSYEALADYNSAISSTATLIDEFSIGKFKMKGLSDMMAEGKEATVQARMQLISLMKSVIHGIMLDGENEDYSRDGVSVAGLAELLDRLALRLCSIHSIPYTRLFGDSPGGLSTDDKSGLTTYYDSIRARQHTELKPAIRKFIDIIVEWKGLKTDFEIEFNPLYSLNELEQSTVEMNNETAQNTRAEMYSSYITNQVLTPEQVFALEWAEKLEGVVVESFGPSAEEMAEELATKMMVQQQEAQAKGQQQAQPASPPNVGSPGKVGNGSSTAGPGGIDVIGQGKG